MAEITSFLTQYLYLGISVLNCTLIECDYELVGSQGLVESMTLGLTCLMNSTAEKCGPNQYDSFFVHSLEIFQVTVKNTRSNLFKERRIEFWVMVMEAVLYVHFNVAWNRGAFFRPFHEQGSKEKPERLSF